MTMEDINFTPPNPAMSSNVIQGNLVRSSIQNNVLVSTGAIADRHSMRFWNAIISAALRQLCDSDEPKGLAEAGFSIRDKKGWGDIHETIEAARENYQDGNGPLARKSKMRRKLGDKSAPASDWIKAVNAVVPDSSYASPILGTVRLIVDVRLPQLLIVHNSKPPLDTNFFASRLHADHLRS